MRNFHFSSFIFAYPIRHFTSINRNGRPYVRRSIEHDTQRRRRQNDRLWILRQRIITFAAAALKERRCVSIVGSIMMTRIYVSLTFSRSTGAHTSLFHLSSWRRWEDENHNLINEWKIARERWEVFVNESKTLHAILIKITELALNYSSTLDTRIADNEK